MFTKIAPQFRKKYLFVFFSESTHDSKVAHASDSDTLVDEEIGRIPTPRLRQEVGSARRHHLDITTPAVGGALLVSPPPGARQQNDDSPNDSLREEPRKHCSRQIPQGQQEDQSESGKIMKLIIGLIIPQ
jgi:hypothetical protein